MTSLLLLLLSLLAVAIWFAANLVRHAHDKAKLLSPEARERNHVVVLAAEDTALQSTPLSETAAAQIPQTQSILDFATDLYADPIDGVPFTMGERVVPCRCGVAYRVDSLDWLSANLGGHCVQCGSLVEHRESYTLP